MTGFDRPLHGRHVAEVESRLGHEIDVSANPLPVHVGSLDLRNFDAVEQLPRDDVERQRPGASVGVADFDFVDGVIVEVRRDFANGDITPFALVVGHSDAGEMLDDLGHVAVGQPADFVAAATSTTPMALRFWSMARRWLARWPVMTMPACGALSLGSWSVGWTCACAAPATHNARNETPIWRLHGF